MALGRQGSKKHRKSRHEGSGTTIATAAASAATTINGKAASPIEESSKPIKAMLQAFWRRHSSSSMANNQQISEKSTSRTQTLSPTRKTTLLAPPAVSSLEQAMRIARGQVEAPLNPKEDLVYDLTNGQPITPSGHLPRIPEHGETSYLSQINHLKASVRRRPNSRSDRSEFNSAPPGIYWPDGETQPCRLVQQRQQSAAEHQGPPDRLPRIPPLSRPTSSLFYAGAPMTSFCGSPTRAISPTPFLHRPLPPPPSMADRRGEKMSKSFNLGSQSSGPMWYAIAPKSSTGEIEVVDTVVYSNVQIPLLRMTSPLVGSGSSTRHSPLAPPPGGSMCIHSQSPPPALSSASSTAHPAQPICVAAGHGQALLRDNRQRQQQHQPGGQAAPASPGVERRPNLSPWRQQQQQHDPNSATAVAAAAAAPPPPPPSSTTTTSHRDSPTVSSTSSFSNCMVVLKGNTQISHHPASPFAPPASTRTSTPGGGVPTASPAPPSDTKETTTAAVAKSSDVEEDDEGAYDRVFCASTAVRTPGNTGRHEPENATPGAVTANLVNGNFNGLNVRSSRRGRRGSKDLVATYEEAWDVKMSRRFGGMDVSRLASSPKANGGPCAGDSSVGGRCVLQRSAVVRTSERQLRSTGTDDAWDANAGGLSAFQRTAAVRASDRPLRSTGVPAAVIKRSPSLSPVLTSTTEGVVMRRRPPGPGVVGRQPMPTPRNLNFRNSSNETVTNREMVTSPFRLKQNRVASPPCKSSVSPSHLERAPVSPTTSESALTDYDYAYNRSWSMGVQLNLSLNLANTSGTTDEDSPTSHCVSKPASPPTLAAPSPVAPPPPPHRSQSQSMTSPASSPMPPVMTPITTQFSPPQSPTPAMRLHRGTTATSPPPLTCSRGVHNPLATGVPPEVSSEGEEEEAMGGRDDTISRIISSSNGGGSGHGTEVPGLLPHMSRLLADWDIVSTDSCEEPWDVKHGKVISQLTSSRFIDPSEVLSAVASGSGTTSQSEEPGMTCYRSPLPASSSSEVSTSHVNCLKPLSEQPWFHPNLTRSGAEKRLRSEPEGSFLVRNSETIKNEYSLTVKHNGFLHMRITRDAQGQFVLGEYSQPYPSIPHMISHYEQTQVPVRGADSVTLCYPR